MSCNELARWLVAATVWIACLSAAASAGARPVDAAAPPDYTWRRGDAVIPTSPGPIIEAPKTDGMGAATVQTATAVQLSVGTAVFTCPVQSPACRVEPGIVTTVALLQRPETWFSWGGSIEAQRFGQTWNVDSASLTLRQTAFSARVLAQVHIPTQSDIDSYVGISLGGGAIHDSARAGDGPETARWVGSPLYGARAGLTFRVSDRIQLGVLVDWTNIQVNTGESCPWVAYGVCGTNNWSAFSPSNALWNATATVSFAFGEEL